MPDKRWDVLSRLILENGYTSMAEIGVKSGRNISEICENCPDLHVIAVDPWCGTDGYVHWSIQQVKRHEREFDSVQARFPDRITKVKLFSLEAAKTIAHNSLDIVFIDGDHSYEGCKSDIKAWLPKVRRGGMIAGHDYHHPRFPGVTKAVDEAFGEIVKSYPDRVWAVKC